MTFIKPNHNKSFINFLLGALCVGVVLGTLWLIVAYNQTVNLNHNILAMKAELDSIGAENTAINNELVATLGSGGLAAAAARDNLVPENKPEYFSIGKQWSIASQ